MHSWTQALPPMTRRFIMKYSQEEKLEIGRQIYSGEMSRYDASNQYGISYTTARDYMRLYRDTNGLPAKRGTPKHSHSATSPIAAPVPSISGIEEYESMSREELIHELVMAKITEARLKKGYEVKGDGSVILYEKENTK